MPATNSTNKIEQLEQELNRIKSELHKARSKQEAEAEAALNKLNKEAQIAAGKAKDAQKKLSALQRSANTQRHMAIASEALASAKQLLKQAKVGAKDAVSQLGDTRKARIKAAQLAKTLAREENKIAKALIAKEKVYAVKVKDWLKKAGETIAQQEKKLTSKAKVLAKQTTKKVAAKEKIIANKIKIAEKKSAKKIGTGAKKVKRKIKSVAQKKTPKKIVS